MKSKEQYKITLRTMLEQKSRLGDIPPPPPPPKGVRTPLGPKGALYSTKRVLGAIGQGVERLSLPLTIGLMATDAAIEAKKAYDQDGVLGVSSVLSNEIVKVATGSAVGAGLAVGGGVLSTAVGLSPGPGALVGSIGGFVGGHYIAGEVLDKSGLAWKEAPSSVQTSAESHRALSKQQAEYKREAKRVANTSVEGHQQNIQNAKKEGLVFTEYMKKKTEAEDLEYETTADKGYYDFMDEIAAIERKEEAIKAKEEALRTSTYRAPPTRRQPEM